VCEKLLSTRPAISPTSLRQKSQPTNTELVSIPRFSGSHTEATVNLQNMTNTLRVFKDNFHPNEPVTQNSKSIMEIELRRQATKLTTEDDMTPPTQKNAYNSL
jgi:hypothetical protein